LASLYEKPLYSLGESEENNEKSQDIRQPTWIYKRVLLPCQA
jgi:hypothetical protein